MHYMTCNNLPSQLGHVDLPPNIFRPIHRKSCLGDSLRAATNPTRIHRVSKQTILRPHVFQERPHRTCLKNHHRQYE